MRTLLDSYYHFATKGLFMLLYYYDIDQKECVHWIENVRVSKKLSVVSQNTDSSFCNLPH